MMSKSKPSYKKFSKVNKKKKVITESETGELSKNNSNSRYPVVSLPEIVSNHIHQEYRRFVNNGGAVNGNLSINDLLNQFMFSVTPLLLYSWIRAVRLKKIRILAPVTTQGTSVFLSLEPLAIDTNQNSYSAVPEQYVDTSASIDIPAYISLTPSIDTPLGSWHYSVNANIDLLRIVAPPGSTMDILFEYILTNETTGSSYTRVVAGATVGIMYTGNIRTNFIPQGRNVI